MLTVNTAKLERMSIITPVYNGERFIDSCIRVVIDQVLDFEHIIIDGGSTDRTAEIIKQYAGEYSHIRWISEKDNGQSDDEQRESKGEILAILNVDDFTSQCTKPHIRNL